MKDRAFITLHSTDGKPSIFNVDNIVRVEAITVSKFRNKENGEGEESFQVEACTIHTTDGKQFRPDERTADVLALLTLSANVAANVEPSIPEMIETIKNADPELLAVMREGERTVGIAVAPITATDARKLFDIFYAEGIGAVWMGESKYFAIQSFEPDFTLHWLKDALRRDNITATIEVNIP